VSFENSGRDVSMAVHKVHDVALEHVWKLLLKQFLRTEAVA
jgi:hypothetical protein